MENLSLEKRIFIRDEWLELRSKRVSKSNRLKAISQKYSVTQKIVKEIACEFNVWTEGDGEDETLEQKRKTKRRRIIEDRKINREVDEEIDRRRKEIEGDSKYGVWFISGIFSLFVVYLIYAFSIEYSDGPFREIIDGVECNQLNQCRETPWYR